MTSPDGPGDLRTLPRPSEGYYDDLTLPLDAVPEESELSHHPTPVLALTDPKVALSLVGLALLIGFALGTLLFGVILRSGDSEAIASTGTAAPSIDDGAATNPDTDPAAPQQAVGADDLGSIEGGMEDPDSDGATPFASDESEALIIGGDETPESAMEDGSTPSSVPETTPTTLATTTLPPTTAATTTAPPTTVATTATTAAPTTAAETTQATANDPAPPAPSGNDSALQQQVLDLTNAERANAGCGPVALDPTLNSVADAHSEDMAANQYFDHTGLNGSQPWDRAQAAGYPARGSGENIAQGYTTAASVMEGWMNSPGHRRNILNCDWTELGVGYAEGNSSGRNIRPLYWTQVFAIRR